MECRNERAVRRALATGLMGVTAADFITWQEDVSSWEAWMGCFREHFDLWRKDGVYVALISLFRRARAVSQNLRRPDGERRVTNFLHLAETLHQASANPYRPIHSLYGCVINGRIRSGQDEYQFRWNRNQPRFKYLQSINPKVSSIPLSSVRFLG